MDLETLRRHQGRNVWTRRNALWMRFRRQRLWLRLLARLFARCIVFETILGIRTRKEAPCRLIEKEMAAHVVHVRAMPLDEGQVAARRGRGVRILPMFQKQVRTGHERAAFVRHLLALWQDGFLLPSFLFP